MMDKKIEEKARELIIMDEKLKIVYRNNKISKAEFEEKHKVILDKLEALKKKKEQRENEKDRLFAELLHLRGDLKDERIDNDTYARRFNEIQEKLESIDHYISHVRPHPSPLQTVGFGRRLAAYLIDGVVLILFGTIFLILGMRGISDLLSYLITPVYYIGMWVTFDGATVGKKILGIKIVQTDGSPITMGQAFLRYIGYFISGILLGLGYAWIIWDEQHQGWHDKIAGTIVIRP